MADAITFQVNLGNGALNLAYNEVVMSQHTGSVYNSTINDLEWSILIVSNPNFLFPWIIFRDAWDSNSALNQETNSHDNNGGVNMSVITVNSSGLTSGTICTYGYPAGRSGSIYHYGLYLINSILILAK